MIKETVLKGIRSFIKNVKVDYLRYVVMRPMFKLNGQVLNGFKSLQNDKFFLYNINGVHLPADELHWFINYNKFENWCDMTALHEYKVKPGDVIIDIGAGIGDEIIVLSERVGDKGKVYAIEANPMVFDVLSKVKSYNKLNNTEIFNIAISQTNEDVELINDGSWIAGSIGNVTKSGSSNVETYKVKGYRLDTFLDEHNIQSIDLLKSNIEGAERFIVDSINAGYINRIKNVAIACHDFRFEWDGNEFFRTKAYISEFLIKHGFEISSQQTGEGYVDDYVYGINKTIKH